MTTPHPYRTPASTPKTILGVGPALAGLEEQPAFLECLAAFSLAHERAQAARATLDRIEQETR